MIADRLTDRETVKQTDRQTDRQIRSSHYFAPISGGGGVNIPMKPFRAAVITIERVSGDNMKIATAAAVSSSRRRQSMFDNRRVRDFILKGQRRRST